MEDPKNVSPTRSVIARIEGLCRVQSAYMQHLGDIKETIVGFDLDGYDLLRTQSVNPERAPLSAIFLYNTYKEGEDITDALLADVEQMFEDICCLPGREMDVLEMANEEGALQNNYERGLLYAWRLVHNRYQTLLENRACVLTSTGSIHIYDDRGEVLSDAISLLAEAVSSRVALDSGIDTKTGNIVFFAAFGVTPDILLEQYGRRFGLFA